MTFLKPKVPVIIGMVLQKRTKALFYVLKK